MAADDRDRALRDAHELMRTGPRAYTDHQAEVISRTVGARRGLPEPALPVEDDPPRHH